MQSHEQASAPGYTRAARRLSGRRARRPRQLLREIGLPYLFLSPFLLLFAAFFLLPLAYALWLSLFADRLIGGTVFAGAQNYLQVLQDGNFWEGVRRTALFGIVQAPISIGLALLFALVLDSGAVRLRTLFRLGYYLPAAIPSVVAALMWGYLYGPTFGPFAQIASAAHLPQPGFLTDAGILPSIGNIVIWLSTGSAMVVMYAALQSVPPEIYDAATMDGATGWRTAWYIKIPLIRPALIMMGIFAIIGTLQLFAEPSILAPLAPGTINDHFTPNLYAYTLAFTNQQYNYAAAMSFTLGVIIFACSSVFMFVVTRRSR